MRLPFTSVYQCFSSPACYVYHCISCFMRPLRVEKVFSLGFGDFQRGREQTKTEEKTQKITIRPPIDQQHQQYQFAISPLNPPKQPLAFLLPPPFLSSPLPTRFTSQGALTNPREERGYIVAFLRPPSSPLHRTPLYRRSQIHFYRG
ncbi:hypothetical protein SAY86_022297 [Trapa natans]|uniref:Uncharacterized protein n=1 Tax=Trapa natans TaxID=22666 RepID=A0AAN7LTA0_TRANT|nr:hypothetical protein SAY86_022297 [Trapa natans]